MCWYTQKLFIPQSEASSFTTTCTISRLLSWKRVLLLTFFFFFFFFFPFLYRTCTRKSVKTAIQCGRYPLKMKKPCCKLRNYFNFPLGRAYYLLLQRENCKEENKKTRLIKKIAASGWHYILLQQAVIATSMQKVC